MKNSTAQQLGLTSDMIQQGLDLLSRPRTVRRKGKVEERAPQVIQEEGKFFLAKLHRAEVSIARHLRRLMAKSLTELSVPSNVFGQLVPDASQTSAIELAARSGVLVLTGGPGVGKTTVAKAMLALFESAGLSVLCCAPTGKAAIRMTQQTGRPASTIHTTLKMRPGCPPQQHEGAPLEAKVVVVDESSMIDVELFSALLAAVPTGARLLIIGDVDQLPSIGAGRALFDIIVSQAVPTVRLTKIHRQASESRIPYAARDINEGRCPDLTIKGSDFTHWETENEWDIAERVLGSVASTITERKGILPSDIQVIAAQYDEDKDSHIGVSGLNRLLQNKLNPAPSAEGDVFIGRSYAARTNDRVIQTRNNYDLTVMNGEMGKVVYADPKTSVAVNRNGTLFIPGVGDVDGTWSDKLPKAAKGGDFDAEASDDEDNNGLPGGTKETNDGLMFKSARVLVVDFGEGRIIAYTKEEARELELGYCITVHKSQGSQFKAVVVVVAKRHAFMLTRALVYTAVTRAEKFCLTIGSAEQLGKSAKNTRSTERRTMLQQRLKTAK